jgi:integrase
VQELLGHNQISMTMDLYSHVLPGIQEDVIDQLGDMLDQLKDDDDDEGTAIPLA